jgi:hypothetical protein
MTKSEELFERFCAERKLSFHKIPESKTKSPDYYLEVGGKMIVAEVKQIDANKEESRVLAMPAEDWGQGEIYHWDIPGERIRNKITSAMPQFKNLSKGQYATLLVVYDNINVWPELIDEYAIRVALYGIETALISSEAAPEGGAKILARWYGMRKKATAHHNTTLSAIAVISEAESSGLMNVYHNWYARIPLERELFLLSGVEQFEMEQMPENSFSNWKRCG